jgi:hypothetical protein
MQTPNKVSKEYRAKLTLNNQTLCTITGSDKRAVQETVQNLFNSQLNLTSQQKAAPLQFHEGENNSTFIYHRSHLDGGQPVGWIAEYDVPLEMSVQSITEHRLQAQKAA